MMRKFRVSSVWKSLGLILFYLISCWIGTFPDFFLQSPFFLWTNILLGFIKTSSIRLVANRFYALSCALGHCCGLLVILFKKGQQGDSSVPYLGVMCPAHAFLLPLLSGRQTDKWHVNGQFLCSTFENTHQRKAQDLKNTHQRKAQDSKTHTREKLKI